MVTNKCNCGKDGNSNNALQIVIILALYTSLCINGCDMKAKGLKKNYNYIITHH